jgi:hypothetical protein
MRLLLSTSLSAGSKNIQQQWPDELDYFHEVDTEGKMFTDVIKEFREAGNRMHVARSTLQAIIMPTDNMIKVLQYRFAGTEPKYEDYQEAIKVEATAFKCLFDTPEVFEIGYPQYTAGDVLPGMSCLQMHRKLRLPMTPCRSPWTPSSSLHPVPRDHLRVVSVLRRSTNRRRYFASICYEDCNWHTAGFNITAASTRDRRREEAFPWSRCVPARDLQQGEEAKRHLEVK